MRRWENEREKNEIKGQEYPWTSFDPKTLKSWTTSFCSNMSPVNLGVMIRPESRSASRLMIATGSAGGSGKDKRISVKRSLCKQINMCKII